MNYYSWKEYCLCTETESVPERAVRVKEPFSPLVFLINRDGKSHRGFYAVSSMDEIDEKEGPGCLNARLPVDHKYNNALEELVRRDGAAVLNVAFKKAFDFLEVQGKKKKSGLKVTLVGLGDVGGTVLTGLKLLGSEIAEIAVFDPYKPMEQRYEMEMNQVLSISEDASVPKVTIAKEENLFDCDLFIFTASRGVPPVGSEIKDVRMAQFEANKTIIDGYAEMARNVGYMGLFCQVSDPVDHLAREMFLASNRDENGNDDFAGLLPEQVQGFGLGVMAARAAYYAEKRSIDKNRVRVYGPHGAGLVVANCCSEKHYDSTLSFEMTTETKEANLRVRDLGFKPYIAPGLSSAAISILRMIRGQEHYGAVPLGGTYFGCISKWTEQGIAIKREEICPELLKRICETYQALKEFQY